MFVLKPGMECSLYITVISVHSIPRYSAYTTKQSTCLTPEELKKHACTIVEKTLRESLLQESLLQASLP
jgi:hypothetical protein